MDGYPQDAATRDVLATALLGYARDPGRDGAREFLEGLSRDELQYIADFLSGWSVDARSLQPAGPAQLWTLVLRFQKLRRSRRACTLRYLTDLEHKTLLLFDYLCRCGYGQAGAARAARQ